MHHAFLCQSVHSVHGAGLMQHKRRAVEQLSHHAFLCQSVRSVHGAGFIRRAVVEPALCICICICFIVVGSILIRGIIANFDRTHVTL